MVGNLSETELNPNVLTKLGFGSKEHGQVIGKPEHWLPLRGIMRIDMFPQPLSLLGVKVIAEAPH